MSLRFHFLYSLVTLHTPYHSLCCGYVWLSVKNNSTREWRLEDNLPLAREVSNSTGLNGSSVNSRCNSPSRGYSDILNWLQIKEIESSNLIDTKYSDLVPFWLPFLVLLGSEGTPYIKRELLREWIFSFGEMGYLAGKSHDGSGFGWLWTSQHGKRNGQASLSFFFHWRNSSSIATMCQVLFWDTFEENKGGPCPQIAFPFFYTVFIPKNINILNHFFCFSQYHWCESRKQIEG